MNNSEDHIFTSLEDIFYDLSLVFTPAERLTVSQAAEKYRQVHQPGSYIGPWKNSTTPYMVEPCDIWSNRDVNKAAFCGPAQSGKTDSIIVNGVAYHIVCEPMDMVVYNPSMAAARDFSNRRIDRLHVHSKDVGKHIRIGTSADNVLDKTYINGMLLTLSWPSVTEFAGKPIGRAVLTDYDRMDDDINGDGNPFDLAAKRTTTFGSFAMTFAESSPSRPILDPKWMRSGAHEAPPTTGILALYNRGDRRKWYWPCPHCENFFTPDFSMLHYDKSAGSIPQIADTVYLKCPHCEEAISPDHRHGMNLKGMWLKEGQYVTPDRVVHGEGRKADMASWWLNGLAAAFTTWRGLVSEYLIAEEEYERTQDEGKLQTFFNTDLAEPYYPRAMLNDVRIPEELKARAEGLAKKRVPHGVRFLVATIDVQKNMFIYQVFGILPGEPFDMVLIDRDKIVYSKRVDDEADVEGQMQWVKPGTYQEDWDLITEHVLNKTYPLDDDSGRVMGIKIAGCDSGGKAGVTANAYAYWRKLKAAGEAQRFILLKGDPLPNRERVRITWPDSSDHKNMAAARGDVPVYMLNSNVIKDMLDGRLDCVTPGRGMIRFPDWLEDWFYDEMCAEIRTAKGWEKKAKRNEAWDLSYYAIGVCLSRMIGIEKVDWSNPMPWMADWDRNPYVRDAEGNTKFAVVEAVEYDFAKLAKELAS
ncbi:putative DNA packaging protein [Achromobacter phage AXY1]|nr:putative DNA packaging protein [Achromobacter phage AXY1]